MQRVLIVFVFWMIALTLIKCQTESSEKTDKSAPLINDGFVGEATCTSCHQNQATEWNGSHHDWAMKPATAQTVLGDFNNLNIELDGVGYSFFKKKDQFLVKIKEINGETKTFEIKHTFGYTPLQQYLVEFEKGKTQVLRVSWDVEKKEWFHQYRGDQIEPHDWLHWTGGAQRWNTMCADCHSTNLKRNYDFKTDSYETSWSSINVSCESCHGPGQRHVEWVESGEDKGSSYMLTADAQQTQINICGPCHARRVRLSENFEPGKSFDHQFILQSMTTEYYHPDGQIEEEDYVMGSFMQSKMYMNGVKCTDCHNPHTLELKYEGNTLCMQCHEPKYNTIEHHFHEMGSKSAECVNCHMRGKVYMGNDFRRDHSFRIPRPDQSVKYGTPNACTGCHADKTDQWAANQVVDWYGEDRPYHYSDDFLLTTKRQEVTEAEKGQILAFIENQQYPDILRASAIQNAQFSFSEKEIKVLLGAMEDSSALVRYYTLNEFMDYPIQDRFHLASKNISDISPMVRVAAARLVVDVDLNQMDPSQRESFRIALNEYEKMLIANADFPLGRLHLGDYYFRKGQGEKAIVQYEKALEMDSLLTLVYQNLATAYSTIGKNKEALLKLNQLIRLESEYGRAYYLRALLHHELGNSEKFVVDMARSIELDPQNFQAYYNLATYYYHEKDFPKAEEVIKKGLKIFPQSEQGNHLLQLIENEPRS